MRLRTLAPLLASALVLTVVGYIVWSLATTPATTPVADQTALAVVAPEQAAPASQQQSRPAAQPAQQTQQTSGVPTPDASWVARTAAKAGIPVPAMRAYARAQLARPQGCDLGWTTLAGIGWVESQNGTLGGRTLGDDGLSSSPIVGPALGGGLDHAYGPMQFIPSTWERWASDGDGDGTADVDDLDDAAMTAMRYLCGTGQDLTTGAGWSRAVFAYNHSQQYVDQVYAAADAYAQRTR
ncbi:lytic murein transglycosylase [Nocardioides sp. BP30]|uniref:lytic murein transglycosylase n=1 Tax=Nocardioides sp. BP30 TaxID=3036374 RepID=UPI002469AB52|nr:lytic murein transglycosylase [Nocardioides sp. BP30]WGL53329.1 lytic murein transglycosylase [Nocardioides sp. BP30]